MNIIWLVGFLLATGYAIWRVRFWILQGRQMQVSGHLPPKPGLLARFTLGWVSYLLTFLGVGPVRVIGAHHARYRGRLLIAPNHTFQLDFAMVRRAVGHSFRYMTDANELHGWRGIAGAWSGAFPVQAGCGDAAIQASVRALGIDIDSMVLIFPQGKLVRDNILRKEDFRYGTARISHQAHEEHPGEPIAILPIALYYKRSPQDRHWTHFLLKPLRKIFGVTNYGGVVVIGEPIPVDSLPADPAEATEVIRIRIQALLDEAVRH